MNKLISYNHIATSTSSLINEICLDFFQKTGISYFTYAKQFKDCSRFSLTTNAKQAEYFFNQQYYRNIVFSHPQQTKTEYWLWNGLPFSEALKEQASLFDIANGFTIIQPHPDYAEYFYFGAKSHEYYMNNVYLNHLEYLHQFCSYFKEKTHNLIQSASKNDNRILLPIEVIEQNNQHPKLNHIRNINNDKTLLLNSFNIDNKGASLTKREIEFSILLTRGNNAKSIAHQLNISVRTAEIHIQNIKHKLDCYNKTHLIKKLIGLGFDKF